MVRHTTARSVGAAALTLDDVQARIIGCDACPRLRAYCARVAREKKRAHRDDTYWGRPVPGFGDVRARVFVLGLAPAAHGANRTGRLFTGDGAGGSCDFLMTALHAHGFATQPTSHHAGDGLRLSDAYISAVCRCAPPDNTPHPNEIANCTPHLEAELAALPHVQVIVALGRVASDACWRLASRRGPRRGARPRFAHGQVVDLQIPGMPVVVESYHPSRQNTNTRRLTPPMMSDVFATARGLVDMVERCPDAP
jgi:uracil-DNA glycosylase family 4